VVGIKNGHHRTVGAGKAVKDLRRHNRALVLELVRTLGPVSKSDLARAAGLSQVTVVEIVGELTREGLVRDAGEGPSTGGRPPVLVELDPQARSAVGLEIGPRTVTAVVTDLNASVRMRVEKPSRMVEGPAATAEQVEVVFGQILREAPEAAENSLGVGVALPAPILVSNGPIFDPPSAPEWGGLDVPQLIGRRFDAPVLVDNDANARALGELLFGAGRGASDMFYVIAHWGVGSALVVDGDLRRGSDGGAGEIGHTVVEVDGPRCGCGGYGCLEAFAGRAGIAHRARRALKLAGRNRLAGVDAEDLKVRHVVGAALQGDELARGILEETGQYLGVGVANAINLLNPEVVVLGGSTVEVGEMVTAPLIKVAKKRALPGMAERARIVKGELGEDAGAVGAAALVLRELFAVSVPVAVREAITDQGAGAKLPAEGGVS
jgi:predicted NBD/HSP70 family sugar kinase